VWIFVAEIIVRFLGRISTREYVRDGWNWFDIVVTAAAFVPEVAGASTILRVLRVLRILRLVRSIPELRLIVSVLTKSITSMTYIGLLMAVCFYVFAVLGHKLFGGLQPEFGSLHESLFTLFGSLTLEGWTDLRNRAIEAGGDYLTVTLFHTTWVVLATFLLVNLIVGAIINNYQEVQEIEAHGRKHGPDADIDAKILELSKELHTLIRLRSKQPM
jgi:voltage-gated sodium channel